MVDAEEGAGDAGRQRGPGPELRGTQGLPVDKADDSRR